MNVGTPRNAASKSSPSNMPPQAPEASPDTAATSVPPIAQSSHNNARRLRHNIGNSRNVKPRVEMESESMPPPEFGAFPPSVIECVNGFFTLGSTNTSKLQVQNKHLRQACRERALADQLAAALGPKPFCAVNSDHFTDIIDKAQVLPPDLRLAILAQIPAELCEHLNYAGHNMEVVIQRLLLASSTGFEGEHQHLLFGKISEAFAQPPFLAHFNPSGSHVIERLQMERIFKGFCARLQDLSSHPSSHRIALVLAQDQAHCMSGGADSTVQKGLSKDAAGAITAITRGLYMVHDADARFDLWHRLTDRLAPASPDLQQTVLPNLISTISCLEPEAKRVMAFKKIIASISSLPAQFQHHPVDASLEHLR